MKEFRDYIDYDYLIAFLTGLQQFLGSKCEISLTDYRRPPDEMTFYIINGKLSGRESGTHPRSSIFLNKGKNIRVAGNTHIFFFHRPGDRLFKACNVFIADENDEIIGSVAVHMEITELVSGNAVIQELIRNPAVGVISQGNAPLLEDIDAVLKAHVQYAEAAIGIPMPLMSKAERIRALDYLDQNGVFKVSKSSNLLCEHFQISRFTLYGDLDEARKLRAAELSKQEEAGSAETDQ